MARKRGRRKDVASVSSKSVTFSENGQSMNIINSNVIVGQSTIGSFSTAHASAQERDVTDASEGHSLVFDDIFVLKERIKKGSRVFKGFQKHASGQTTPVAIKMISPFDEKNLREVKHLLTLTPHPNVVAIIRSKKLEGRACPELYIVMELCDYATFKDYCEKTPFNFNEIMSYCKQLLNGIKHIHDNRIIHGDLKPENILFSLDRKFIKVSDFGISKQLQSGRSKTKRTSEGTESYRAPETFDSNIISMRADIYSLGIVLFGAFTNGSHPYGKEGYTQVYNMRKNKHQDFSALPGEMGLTRRTQFCDLLENMMNIDPRQRPTVDEVLQHPFFNDSSLVLNEKERKKCRKVPKAIHLPRNFFVILLLFAVFCVRFVPISRHGHEDADEPIRNITSYERDWVGVPVLTLEEAREITSQKLLRAKQLEGSIRNVKNNASDSLGRLLFYRYSAGMVDIRPFYNHLPFSYSPNSFNLYGGLVVCFAKATEDCQKYKKIYIKSMQKFVADIEIVTFPFVFLDTPSLFALLLWFDDKNKTYVVINLCDMKMRFKRREFLKSFTMGEVSYSLEKLKPMAVLSSQKFIYSLIDTPPSNSAHVPETLLFEIFIELDNSQTASLKIFLR